jgi:uracil-DNA glycosylase
MSTKLDIEDIKEKIHAKLKPSGWDRVLRGFIFSKEFETIIQTLAKQSKDGKRFTPTMRNWFRAFEECPYDQLKVVIVGQDPYPGLDQADGIAFSLKDAPVIQPSLDYMLKEINKTVYNGVNASRDKDLTRWANQGVLLINIALTTTIGKVGQHYLVWRPFIAYLFDWLTWHNNGLVYIYMGKKAEEWADAVNDNNYKFFTSHPASASYNNLEEWDSKNVFVETKEILKKNYNFEIEW